MRSIRFSDQVESASDGRRSVASNSAPNSAPAFRRNSHHGSYNSLPMHELPRPSSVAAMRRNIYSGKAPSIAASDTSSAAGFGPRTREIRTAALARSFAMDDGDWGPPPPMGPGPPIFPRPMQDYLDELEYRGGPPPFLDAASVTTSSPYSPRSADSSNYTSGMTRASSATPLPREPILKNGTLPRSHSRTSASYTGTLERPGYGKNHYNSMEFNGSHRSNSKTGINTYANGSVMSSPAGSALSNRYKTGNGTLNNNIRNGNGYRHTSGPGAEYNSLSRPKRPAMARQTSVGGVITNPMNGDALKGGMNGGHGGGGGGDYPAMPKRTTSMQIIATPHRPCFECNCWDKMTGVSEGGRGHTPICVLFTVFLVFSMLVVSGVMLYLRGGET